MRKKVDPVITKSKLGTNDEIINEHHPCYGIIRASRVSGNSYLFGSSILHHNYINITISKAHKYRDLHHDRYSSDEEVVSVNLSNVQFADLVANMNCYNGTPCTFDHIDRVMMPECPNTDKKSEYKAEVGKVLNGIAAGCDDLVRSCNDILNNSKMKKSDQVVLKDKINSLVSAINSHLPFINDSMTDSFEEVIIHAKGEIDSAITSAIHRAGVAAFTSAIGCDNDKPVDGSFFIEDKRE